MALNQTHKIDCFDARSKNYYFISNLGSPRPNCKYNWWVAKRDELKVSQVDDKTILDQLTLLWDRKMKLKKIKQTQNGIA